MNYSPYSSYRGKSIGRLLHWIYNACGLNTAELVMVGVREIMLNDKLIATYVWSKVDGVDMPVFNFYHEHHKTYFATIQEQMQTEEIVLELSHNLDQAKKILNRVVKAEGDPFVLRRIKSVIEEFLKG